MYLLSQPIKFIFVLTICISLCATVTNLIPVSLFFVWLLLLLPVLMIKQESCHKVLFCLFLIYIYFSLSVLIYNPSAFANAKFYRRDGNFFITFLPLMIFGLLRLKLDVEGLVDVFLKFATFLNFIAMFVYLTTGYVASGSPEYSSLFVTHNAGGGYLGTLVGFSIGFWMMKKRPIYLFILMANCLGLLLTESRGTQLGLIAALVTHYVLKERHNKKILFLYIAILSILMFFSYPIWDGMSNHASSASLVELNIYRGFTIIARLIYLWPPALYLWLHSPVFGTGFGSYNDVPYDLKGIPYLFQLNASNHFLYNDGHAHHSFLHILAETGLVGLALVLIFLYQVWKFIMKLESEAFRHGLAMVFWIAVWSSMTEHRLFTPSQMLPFTMILGLALGNHRAETRYSINQGHRTADNTRKMSRKRFP